jgi:hypothetical protein
MLRRSSVETAIIFLAVHERRKDFLPSAEAEQQPPKYACCGSAALPVSTRAVFLRASDPRKRGKK